MSANEIEKAHLPREVDIGAAKRGVWLVKVHTIYILLFPRYVIVNIQIKEHLAC